MIRTHSTQPITVEEISKENYKIIIKKESHMFEKSELRELMQIIDNTIL